MGVSECEIIKLPKITDRRGNLTFVESSRHIPFDIKRVYYLYDIPGGETRGGHAHKTLKQFMVALSGSFDVVLYDGIEKKRITLNRPDIGLYIPPMIWRELENFSSGAVCLVFASEYFTEADYIRDLQSFEAAVRKRN